MKTIILIISLIFISQSFANNSNFKLEAEGAAPLYEFSGQTTGYNDFYVKNNKRKIDNYSDGYADFGLILPSFTKRDLIFFDLNRIISPKSDTIKIVGQKIDIPSNISIPKQRESYIISVKVKKPQFRAYVTEHDSYKLTAIHGRFKVSPVIKKLRKGKPIYELLNDFEFLGGTQIKVNTKNKNSDLNLKVNEFNITGSTVLKAPKYDQNQLTLLTMPLESINGKYHPTDLKYINSGDSAQVKVNNNGRRHYSLNVLTDQVKKLDNPFIPTNTDTPELINTVYLAEFNRISMSFLPIWKTTIPQFLDIPKAPKLTSNGKYLEVYPPKRVSGAVPSATIVELVQAEQVINGKIVSEHKKVLWSRTYSGWITKIKTPHVTIEPIDKAIYRYEVSYVANRNGVQSQPTSGYLDDFSFLSKNYLVID